MNLEQLRDDCARKQKKGIHFIIGSVIIWVAVFIIHSTSMDIDSKNLFTFCATAPLMPIAYMVSRILKIDFTHKENPLTSLGLLFSVNQVLYLLIAMWVMNQQPEKLVMVLAMIFGAHLLPYSWLYKSISYRVLSVIITLAAMILGILFDSSVVAMVMIAIEVVFVILLILEIRAMGKVVVTEV